MHDGLRFPRRDDAPSVQDNELVEVSSRATIAEVKQKAGLPRNAKAYDPQSGMLLNDGAAAPDRLGVIEDFEQG